MAKLLRMVVLTAALLVAGHAGAQQDWPNRPVRFIVPLAAGGVADTVCRLMAERLGALWGQQVIVENRAGGNAIPGTEAIARAAPDGYTIGLGIITTMAASPFLYEKLAYNVETDFTPIVMMATSPLFLVVNPVVPANDLQSFLAYARANPDRLAFASTGYGSSLHLAAEQLMQRTGIRMVHVPYKGMGNAMQDLLGGQVQVAVDITSMAQVRQGKLKALGVASTKRFEGQPNVPSFAEQGLPGFEAGTWLSVHAPAGVPPAIQARLNADFNRVLQTPEVRERLLQLNHTVVGDTPEALTAFLVSERAKYAAIIKAGNIKVE